MTLRRLKLPAIVFLMVFVVLSIVHCNISRPMLLLERFFPSFGWIEIVVVSLYAGFTSFKMQDVKNTAKWRLKIWTLFSFVFFGQLLLGFFGIEECLMKQDMNALHFPIPAMILSGPLFRGELTFMTILFLSTVLLTGPAWCSYLCYFGAIDGLASIGKRSKSIGEILWNYKIFWLVFVISATLVLRFFDVTGNVATVSISAFGIVGLVILFFVSRKKKIMFHCIYWCPVGTLVSVFKYASPFRIKIQESCSACGLCTHSCKYLALSKNDIANLKPGLSCTLCGDCLDTCHSQSIVYSFFGLKHNISRTIFLCITISCHAIFLALARI